MEHAIRKHCTVHFDEDPAFYKRLSEKLEKLIQQLPRQLGGAGRGATRSCARRRSRGGTETVDGLDREATTFYDYVVQLAFDGGEVPAAESRSRCKKLMRRTRGADPQDTIDILDFWKKPIEVKQLRGDIDTAILLTDIPELIDTPRAAGGRDRQARREAPRGADPVNQPQRRHRLRGHPQQAEDRRHRHRARRPRRRPRPRMRSPTSRSRTSSRPSGSGSTRTSPSGAT